MRCSTLSIYGVILTVVAVSLVGGNESTSAPPNSGLHLDARDDSPAVIFEPPKHFILNPDFGRPLGYPAEISLKELEAFLKTERPTSQGCGGMTWEGRPCGMFVNGYAAAKTPWLNEEVALDAAYAETKTGTFLAHLTLGRNTYRRPDRESDKFVWERNYEPQDAQQVIYRAIFGDDPTKRKELLVKIRNSLQGLDVRGFSVDARAALRKQMEHCEIDSDTAVAKLANEVRTMLSGP
jgi:hypothetical protein